ncbi:MAG TPA: hypothetical protein VF178_01105 [Gemmatimonadaceae bacterium]
MNARRHTIACLVTSLMFALSCADFEGAVDPTHGFPDTVVAVPVFSRDIAPLFERRCAIGGCHTPQSAQASLVLTPDVAYDNLVGVPSRLRPTEIRVVPGDAPSSWLMAMIGDDQAARGGFSRMPLGSSPLTPNQIATIANWINHGAERE